MPYATLQQVRDEGLTVSEASDSRVNALIAEATSTIDRITGQFFETRQITLEVYGRGSKWLHLPVFAQDVTEVRFLNRSDASTTIVNATSYHVFERFFPDDRYNPRLELLVDELIHPTSHGAHGTHRLNWRLNWARGTAYEIDADWGWVESDGTTPDQITRACILLVVMWAGQLADPDVELSRRAADLEEIQVQGRREKYGGPTSIGTLTGSVEVDRILAAYRRPIEVLAA